jgi:tRNA dimethylallyltransferase
MHWAEPFPLVVIVGPTGVGKTEVSIRLAERLSGEIVSADSRLFYRGLDIGTAKPSLNERQRVPHHLIDVADPDETWSLAVFQQAARKAIEEIHQREHLPFLVGGTGQYVQAVIEGWTIPPQKPDVRLRQALERWGQEIGPEGLHRRLARLDPEAAQRIDYRNLRRTIRALEVILGTGRLFSAQRSKVPSRYSVQLIGLSRPRAELYTRIDARIDAMLATGLVDELKGLLDRGISPDATALSAIGYREIVAYLQGKTSLEGAIVLMKRHTRQFVRRQSNWFKETDPAIHWEKVTPETATRLEVFIRNRFCRD